MSEKIKVELRVEIERILVRMKTTDESPHLRELALTVESLIVSLKRL